MEEGAEDLTTGQTRGAGWFSFYSLYLVLGMDGPWVLSEPLSPQPQYLLLKPVLLSGMRQTFSVVLIYISGMASKVKHVSSLVLLGICASSPENCVLISLAHFFG